MGTVTIAEDLFSIGFKEAETGVRIINHTTMSNVIRNKIVLQNYLFSLIVEGTKAVHTTQNSITVDGEKFLLLLPGNYLMTEKITSPNGRFESVLLFFTQESLSIFFSKYAGIIKETQRMPLEQVHVFAKDQFLKNFIHSLVLMFENEKEIPAALQQVKLEELLLYLCYRFPEKMEQLRIRANNDTTEIELRKLVESNVSSNITLDELAFLCNLSLSTFKRKFIKLYGVAPSKWFLQRRMELATALIRVGKEKPGEIYYKVGYESHSSFTHSFKQVFGITPTEYRERVLT